ncbi:hypothetical protein NN561_017979 [Cricetulus griseus]
MNTRRISRPARVLEQFCPCRAAVASGVRGHGGFGGDVVFCFHPESRRSQRAEPASRRRALACVRSSRWPRGAARCLGSGGEDGAGQSGTRCAPPRVNRARPRASAEPLVCGALIRSMFSINPLENLKLYISSRPPLVVFMISVSAMAIAFLTLGYFFKIKEIKSPEMAEDWNTFLLRFNDLDLCVSENETLKHLSNDTTTPESTMTIGQARSSTQPPQALEESGPINISVAITLTLDPLKPFGGYSRNVTHLYSTILGHQIGLSVIKGRPSKLRQSNPEFCPEKAISKRFPARFIRTTATLVNLIWLVGVKIDMAAAHRPRALQALGCYDPAAREPPRVLGSSLTYTWAAVTAHLATLLRLRQAAHSPGKKLRKQLSLRRVAFTPSVSALKGRRSSMTQSERNFELPLAPSSPGPASVLCGQCGRACGRHGYLSSVNPFCSQARAFCVCWRPVGLGLRGGWVIRSQEKSVPGAPDSSFSLQKKQTHVSGVKIFYGSQTGTAKITSKNVCAFLVATYTDGHPTESAEWFCKWLEEAANDFRFGKTYLKGLRYAVFGLGDSAYQSHFNKVSTNVDKWLWMLGAQRVLTRGEGDRNAVQSKHGSIEADFTTWKTKFISRLQTLQSGEKKACSGDCKKGKCETTQPDSGEMGPHLQGKLHPRDVEEEEPCESSSEEELGTQDYQSLNSLVDVEDLGNIMSPMKKEKREKAQQEEKAGVNRNPEKSADSEGRAMITPALREALTKQGVPGLKAERFEEGMEVKHCALSLVGEPIMYPEINRLLKLLHQHGISSFLVTNAQFPEEIRNLRPVTQLYVSVDASTKDSLKKIDRPLFKDFWQRFLDSLKALAAKGVTYCGESAASSLTMANVPWHEEVVRFVQELVDLLPDYEIACEHEHSNCLLIGHKKFKISGEWWTWIDYSRFQELVLQYEESGGSKTFSASDYMARTPQWALFGARERGFDPKDTRYQRKNKAKDISGC